MVGEFMRTSELAEYLRVPEGTLRYWRYMRRGPRSVRLGRRVVYRRADVEDWINSQYEAERA
jgi:excisionase family DNA binding protein